MGIHVETLYDLWVKRNPRFEQHYEHHVIKKLCDYGTGASSTTSAKGKILGGGYEVYIMAFFIGLYSNKRLPLSGDTKVFGQPIGYWGNLESKKGRKAYSDMRDYVFAALLAKTDIDLLALDKETISPKEVITELIGTMEEYANYGLSIIADKLGRNPNYFYDNTSFLNIFLSLTTNDDAQDDDPESLD